MVYKLKLKKKKYFPFLQNNSLPFPLMKTGEKIPALFNGFSVEITKTSYFGVIHNNGCYGKGSISRSAPKILKKNGKDLTNDVKNTTETLILDLEEAFFLTHFVNVLEIKNIKEEIIDDYELFTKFCTVKSNFIDSLVVYLYLKSNEWIIKSGIKFGANFLLYKGNVGLYHASFVAIIVNNIAVSTKNIQVIQRVAESANKDVMILQTIKPNNLDLDNIQEVLARLTDFKVQEVILKRFDFSKNK